VARSWGVPHYTAEIVGWDDKRNLPDQFTPPLGPLLRAVEECSDSFRLLVTK